MYDTLRIKERKVLQQHRSARVNGDLCDGNEGFCYNDTMTVAGIIDWEQDYEYSTTTTTASDCIV